MRMCDRGCWGHGARAQRRRRPFPYSPPKLSAPSPYSQVGMWDITKHKNALPRLEHLVKASDEEVLAMIVNPMAAQYITAGNDTLVRTEQVCERAH